MNRKMLWMLSVVLTITAVAGANTITITAPDSLNVNDPSYTYPYLGHNGGTDDGVMRLIIDMGQPVLAETFQIINPIAASNWAIKASNVYIAADESDPGFIPVIAGSYSVHAFGSTPWTTTSQAVREIDTLLATPVYRQYYRLDVWSNGWGAISGTTWNGTTSTISFSDLLVVPEPFSMVLLGVGSLMMIRRKRA